MAADVPPGGRSYVQTRFLATEDSSTLTKIVRLFVFKNIHSSKTGESHAPRTGGSSRPSGTVQPLTQLPYAIRDFNRCTNLSCLPCTYDVRSCYGRVGSSRSEWSYRTASSSSVHNLRLVLRSASRRVRFSSSWTSGWRQGTRDIVREHRGAGLGMQSAPVPQQSCGGAAFSSRCRTLS